VPGNEHEALFQDQTRASESQAMDGVSIRDALTTTLQIAFEAAVFPNRFEIDEQEPLSRLEALTEQLLQRANCLPSNGTPEVEEVACRATAISIISEVSRRIRATIQ
jgi:hypothetical protein